MDFMFRMVITWFCIVGLTKEAMAVVVSSPLNTGIYPSPGQAEISGKYAMMSRPDAKRRCA